MKIDPNQARPCCPECGAIVDPKKCVVLHTLRGDESWIHSPDLLYGVYCNSDHLLNAWLRGWASAALHSLKPKRKTIRRKPRGE